MNTHFKRYNVVSTFNSLSFKIEKVLFKITKIDDRMII